MQGLGACCRLCPKAEWSTKPCACLPLWWLAAKHLRLGVQYKLGWWSFLNPADWSLFHFKQQRLASMQGREKIGLVLAFTNMGFDVVVSDVDTVWLQDPLPFLAQYPEADVLVSSDSLVRTVPPLPVACWSLFSPQHLFSSFHQRTCKQGCGIM